MCPGSQSLSGGKETWCRTGTFILFSLVLRRLRGTYVSFGRHIIATCANTSSGEVLQTGTPLTSSIRSPLCTEASRSALRIAESNLETG